MTVLFVTSASLADAVMPTTVPAATFSLTAFAVAFVSVGVVTADSLTSLTAIV